MPVNYISEDNIEQAILQKLKNQHGFELLNCFTADPKEPNDKSNRKDKRDVVLSDRLKSACIRLNPQIPEETINKVIEKVMDRRASMSSIAANRELDRMIRDGIPVEFISSDGEKQQETVKVSKLEENQFEMIVV